MPNAICILTLVVSLGLSARVNAVTAQSPVPIHDLSAPDAKSADHFGTILGVRPLADGKLLVNDGQRRQLSILDEKLGARTVAIDSVAVGGQSYGPVASPLIPFLGDSTQFVDGASSSLLLLSPSGAIVKAMAAPKPRDIRNLAYGTTGVDNHGSLLYFTIVGGQERQTALGVSEVGVLDSGAVIRANFDTRAVDTIARLTPVVSRHSIITTTSGRTVNRLIINPLNITDDSAVLSDGTIAIVRGHDYHIDFVDGDGKRSASPKLAFDFKRLSDADKQALIDSARADQNKRDSISKLSDPNRGKAVSVESSTPIANTYRLEKDYVPLKEIPDYWPPIRANAAKADLDNNVWILPTTSAQSKNGELIYDVVNNRGEMTERVRIPAGRSIAGFGKNGVVYLMYREADGWIIERTHVN